MNTFFFYYKMKNEDNLNKYFQNYESIDSYVNTDIKKKVYGKIVKLNYDLDYIIKTCKKVEKKVKILDNIITYGLYDKLEYTCLIFI